jgi:hypothetical protein
MSSVLKVKLGRLLGGKDGDIIDKNDRLGGWKLRRAEGAGRGARASIFCKLKRENELKKKVDESSIIKQHYSAVRGCNSLTGVARCPNPSKRERNWRGGPKKERTISPKSGRSYI